MDTDVLAGVFGGMAIVTCVQALGALIRSALWSHTDE